MQAPGRHANIKEIYHMSEKDTIVRVWCQDDCVFIEMTDGYVHVWRSGLPVVSEGALKYSVTEHNV